MTLAADGHFVKVHQIIVAVASPYIKELLCSADCAHPVIFLNKISYYTLSSILQYIYTGEVLVAVDNLQEFADAGKELFIRGLEDMKIEELLSNDTIITEETHADQDLEDQEQNSDENYCFGVTIADEDDQSVTGDWNVETIERPQSVQAVDEEVLLSDIDKDSIVIENVRSSKTPDGNRKVNKAHEKDLNLIQYTVSNQGSLQLVLNRFVYYLKYASNRSQTRQWRCVDYLNKQVKCPAHIITKGGAVSLRISAHTHPYHDNKILKKVRSGAVFSVITDAEHESRKRMENLKLQRQKKS